VPAGLQWFRKSDLDRGGGSGAKHGIGDVGVIGRRGARFFNYGFT